MENVEFVHADGREFSAAEPFDAIVERLLLFHLPDREEVLRRQLDALRPGGTMVLIEFDCGSIRAEPEASLVEAVRIWIEAAFRSAGADPRIGAQAAELLRRAGFADVSTFGVQRYFAPDDPVGRLVRGRHAHAGAADRRAGHRDRGGARPRHAAGADRGGGRRPRRGDPRAGGGRRLGRPPGRDVTGGRRGRSARVRVIPFVLLAVALAGCGSAAPEAAERSAGWERLPAPPLSPARVGRGAVDRR